MDGLAGSGSVRSELPVADVVHEKESSQVVEPRVVGAAPVDLRRPRLISVKRWTKFIRCVSLATMKVVMRIPFRRQSVASSSVLLTIFVSSPHEFLYKRPSSWIALGLPSVTMKICLFGCRHVARMRCASCSAAFVFV
jgi:hypothetical protein